MLSPQIGGQTAEFETHFPDTGSGLLTLTLLGEIIRIRVRRETSHLDTVETEFGEFFAHREKVDGILLVGADGVGPGTDRDLLHRVLFIGVIKA